MGQGLQTSLQVMTVQQVVPGLLLPLSVGFERMVRQHIEYCQNEQITWYYLFPY